MYKYVIEMLGLGLTENNREFCQKNSVAQPVLNRRLEELILITPVATCKAESMRGSVLV
jgi:hypothetical protein